jgi:nitroimidazol reductase NimA-like FMN-containing flavoprotein (pyridoxamine 5'-phosphate oxidase superfamily)
MKILDASEPEFGGPMTEDEVRDFLVNSKKNVHISSLDEKGEPNIHPTWYYSDNNDDKLYIESGKESKKTRNLRRNSIVYYCIDDDKIPYKGVRGKGTVRISDDVDYNLSKVERIVVKYLGSVWRPTSGRQYCQICRKYRKLTHAYLRHIDLYNILPSMDIHFTYSSFSISFFIRYSDWPFLTFW